MAGKMTRRGFQMKLRKKSVPELSPEDLMALKLLRKDGVLVDGAQERFCQEYIRQPNATEAYHVVFPNVTRGTAQVQSCLLLKQPHIRLRIGALMATRARGAMADRDEILEVLTQIVRGRVCDYMTCGKDGASYIDYGPESINLAAVKKIKTRTEVTGSGDDLREALITEFELESRVPAAVAIGKWQGYEAAERRDVKVSGTLTVADLVEDADGATRGLPPPPPPDAPRPRQRPAAQRTVTVLRKGI